MMEVMIQNVMHLSRLVEESDYQATTELFGQNSTVQSLDDFIPKSESDFLEYAELVAQKIRLYEVKCSEKDTFLPL